MYEAFYGLARRPFAAAPDAATFVPVPGAVAALEQIERCVRDGAGIAVLTAAAGAGKTLICQRLERSLADEFAVAYLPNAGFPSRRGLLQAALYELGRPQLRLGEAELRQELAAVARERGRPVLLILDEAHRYPERILDESRAISNLVEAGEPIARIVLAGQLALEETLADPQLDGLNDRVGVQASLPRLTAAESLGYLRDRAAAAGGRIESLFADDALELIVRASGGVPRCLNQLADHSLLLGFVAERRPVDAGLVREALDDLRRLPLQWAAAESVATIRSVAETAETDGNAAAAETESDGLRDSATVVEFGADFDEPADDAPAELSEETESVEFGTLDAGESWDEDESSAADERPMSAGGATAASAPRPATFVSEVATAARPDGGAPSEEPISDRFARIDAAACTRRWLDEMERAGEGTLQASEGRSVVDPLSILDRIEPLIAEALETDDRGAMPAAVGAASRASQALEADDGGVAVRPPATSEGRELGTVAFATLFRDLRRQQSQSR